MAHASTKIYFVCYALRPPVIPDPMCHFIYFFVFIFLYNQSVRLKLMSIAFASFSFSIHFLRHLLFLSFFSFYFLGHSFFCMQLLTSTTRDIFHLQSFFFFFSYSFLHWLLAIFFSIILYSYLFSYFHVYNFVFLDSFISPSYFICLQFIYSFSHLTIDIYNLFMCFVPSFLLSFKYSCKYSFFDSLLIIHIILILFSEYSDVNKSIFDGSYTATIFLKLTCSLLMLIWFDMWTHLFYT